VILWASIVDPSLAVQREHAVQLLAGIEAGTDGAARGAQATLVLDRLTRRRSPEAELQAQAEELLADGQLLHDMSQTASRSAQRCSRWSRATHRTRSHGRAAARSRAPNRKHAHADLGSDPQRAPACVAASWSTRSQT
jgi:hypothetical protein